ncbi:SDR family oxidoreductase [Kosakonia quasisacchari]|uniref:SDR family oxidoreductase n=1 Tax=Kosakonia quasisacchari TaxID=2529380 RepID=A0A4R0H738_9ENTR|nr:SDR family oxidoreductase [Kosakonia quasisacchari]TCC03469.1 SDR family oxidoreductase [Kosakonia quasisacchari]
MTTWLITGASSGLGLLMTQTLLARGDRVVACVRRADAISALQAQYASRLHVSCFDMTDSAALRREVDAAFTTFGVIERVVSNAGYGLFGAAEEVSDAQIDRQIATNLTGSIQLVRAVLPWLRAQHGGRIVQVSSEGGQVAYPNFSLYHASKWGIEGFLESVAQEVKPFGIEIVIAEPGPTQTGFGAGLDHAAPLAAYDNTPAGEVRRGIANGSFDIKGDAQRTVDAIIAAADAPAPPFRVPLGSLAWEHLVASLRARLAEIERQRDVAYSADRD